MTAPADSATADVGPVASPSATWLAVAVVALGHLGLLVAFPDGIGVGPLLAVEGALLVVAVGAEFLLGGRSQWTVAALMFAWLLLVGGTLVATLAWDLWAVALALVVCVALASYALHRVELVSLGLVEVADERE